MRRLKLLLICALALLLGAHVCVANAAPANDDCANATPVGEVTDLHFDTTEATFDGPGHCTLYAPNIWYRYTPTCSGCITVSLCGSIYDTRLTVYDGGGCNPTENRMIECNDDFCGQQSQITFQAIGGRQYLIEVGGYSDRAGQGLLTISTCGEEPAPAPNDDCANATPVGNVTDLPFDTRCATFDGPGDCATSPNIWYLYTATCNGYATVSLCGSHFDTKLAVYNGASCYSPMMACNDDYCDSQSQITFPVTAGDQRLIEVAGWSEADTGTGVLSISCGVQPPPPPPPSPPSNNNCHNATLVGNVTNLPFNTTGATFDGPGHYMTTRNIWYLYTATCTGQATVSLCGSIFDTKLAVYNGGGCWPSAGALLAFSDDYCGQQSQFSFPAIVGNQYLIEVGGWSQSDYGPGVINISCGVQPPPPPYPQNNDDCVNAIPVGNVTNLPFNTTGTTFDGPARYMTSPNIWYRYTATCTGQATVSLCGSQYNTKLAVYDGTSCWPPAAALLAYNANFCGLQSQVTLPVTAGNQYLIEVGGWAYFDTGTGVITISCDQQPYPQPYPPPNNNCYSATLVGNVTNLSFDTTRATPDGPGHCITSPNLWYRYTATCTGDVIVSLCGSQYDTKLAVYDGPDCYPTQGAMIECNDDSCGLQSQTTFAAIAGNTYLIEVGGYGSDTGQGLLSISCEGGYPQAADLGDAPDSTNNFGATMTAYPMGGPVGVRASYPTVFNDASGTGPHGPIHLNSLAVAHLGKSITRENEADIGSDQDGLNNITPFANSPDQDGADDGVVFPLNLPHCDWTTFDYLVNVTNPGTDLWVNVWLDWNRDGDWDDTLNCPGRPAPEWAVQNQYLFNLPAGLQQLTTQAFLSWHPQWGRKEIWMRITLSEQPWTGGSDQGTKGSGGSGPRQGYEIGETEDYYFVPDTSAPTCDAMCQDLNGDGIVNSDDLTVFMAEWLASCP